MTALLAIDTSVSCSVGVTCGQRVCSRTSDSNQHAAQEVLVLVESALADAGKTLSQLASIAVVTGPGSFTGLRIGIGAAQGLSSALQIPVIPVSALALQAWLAALAHGHRYWLVAQPARGEEIFFGAYEIDPCTGFRLLGREQLGPPADLDAVPGQDKPLDWAAVGDAWAEPGRLIQSLGIEPRIKLQAQPHDVEALCNLGLKRMGAGYASDTLVLPNYVGQQMKYQPYARR